MEKYPQSHIQTGSDLMRCDKSKVDACLTSAELEFVWLEVGHSEDKQFNGPLKRRSKDNGLFMGR